MATSSSNTESLGQDANASGPATVEREASKSHGSESGTKRELEDGPAADAPPKKAAKKASKTSASATLLDKVIEAIRSEKKPGGSSRISIKKYLVANYQITNEKALKKAFQGGLDSGRLVQNKASFEVAGEAYAPPPESRVDVKVLRESPGGTIVGNNCQVKIDYKGYLKGNEGKKAFEMGADFTFITGQGDVIKGMDMGVLGATEGETRRVTIPYQLGYGKRGSGPEIPPCSDLVFDITVRQSLMLRPLSS
jgi:FKBP-type peptidyl-prolyl cis-trans isomerase